MNLSRQQTATGATAMNAIPTMSMTAFFAANTSPLTGVIMTAKTAVKLNKKDVATKTIPNPFGPIFKIYKAVVSINKDYEKDVNQNRAIEGKEQDFQKEGLKWGRHAYGKAIIEKDGGLYLQTIVEGYRGGSEYVDENGNPVDFEAIKPFMPVKKEEAPKQGLEDAVIVRTFKYESILQLAIKTDNLVINLVQ